MGVVTVSTFAVLPVAAIVGQHDSISGCRRPLHANARHKRGHAASPIPCCFDRGGHGMIPEIERIKTTSVRVGSTPPQTTHLRYVANRRPLPLANPDIRNWKAL